MRARLSLAFLLLVGPAAAADFPDAARLRQLEAQYAPVDLRVDLSGLPEGEKRALAKLVEASRLMDAIFLRQAWAGNEALLLELLGDESPLGRSRLAYFLRNKGPWDRLNGERPFIPGVPQRPAAANFYPADATREEVEAWMKGLPEAERARAGGFFTLVRRTGAPGSPAPRQLAPVPYGLAYQGELGRAAALLREAAAATSAPTLKAFLEKRAEAFLTDDYYASDVAWMELDAAVEPTIGPYETYGDGWFNAKAAFEAFVCVRDEAETQKLSRFSGELQEIEDHLPIEPALRNPKLGALAPIRVVNEVFAAGDGAHGVTTAAYNLPNDEKVVQEKGSKRVMLKNVQEAKFQKVLLPVAQVALSPADRKRVSFDAFFTHILVHELMHGLGPHQIRIAGKPSTVRQELQDAYPALEEAKADVSGLFALQRLIDRKVIDRGMQRTLYVTFLASAFRSIRFGLSEAHGQGTALQLNWLLDQGAVTVREDGTFAVDDARVRPAVEALTREIMTLQAKGDRAGAQAMLKRLTVVRPEARRVLERLRGVPVDVAPRFVTAAELTRR
jgi:hypothetical protein